MDASEARDYSAKISHLDPGITLGKTAQKRTPEVTPSSEQVRCHAIDCMNKLLHRCCGGGGAIAGHHLTLWNRP